MDKKNKGLADNHDGDFILNESGTSVSNGWDATENLGNEELSTYQEEERKREEEDNQKTGNTSQPFPEKS